MAVQPIPAGYHTVTPYVLVRGASALIDYLKSAFDAQEVSRLTDPKGTVKNAEIRIGDSMIYLAEAPPNRSPMPASLYVYVKDADATYRQGLAAGGSSLMEPANRYYGDRIGGVMDAFGNHWWIATHIEDVSAGEMQRRSDAEEIKRIGKHAESRPDQPESVAMTVTETFFSVKVNDMQRATSFYVDALGADVLFASPRWSSLRVAGVRLGLFLNPEHTEARIGLHFVVSDLEAARGRVLRAGGRIVTPSSEVAPGVVVADVTDTEGNGFALRQA
jgi:uncharacterized glyoxalase superfamily protein PhnB